MSCEKKFGLVFVFCICCVLSVTHITSAQSELTSKVEDLADKLTSSTSAEIIGVEGEIIYINLGEKDAISEGSEFEVVRLGEVITVGSKALHKERPVGEIQITKVRKDMSLARVTASFAQVQKGDKVYQKRKKVQRIALTEFPYSENFNNLTKNIYEGLSVSFAQKGLQVVERSQLDKVLAEQKIAHSGIVDISTAKKLGSLLGTEAVVLGTVSDVGNNVAIRARLVDAGKGVVITAAQVEVTKNPEILAMLDGGRKASGGGAAVGAGGSSGGSQQGPGKKSDLFFENDSFRIDVVSFTREPAGLILKLKLLNLTNEPIRTNLADPEADTYLVDEIGNQYPFKESEMGSRQIFTTFAPGAPRISTIIFRDQKPGGKEFTLSMKFFGNRGKPDFFASMNGLTLK